MTSDKYNFQSSEAAIHGYGINDLVNLLLCRRYLFSIVFGIVLLTSVAVMYFTPKTYLYTQYLQSGSYASSEDIRIPIQKSDQLVEMIQSYYIPKIWNEISKTKSLQLKGRPSIAVKKVSDTGLILMEIKTTPDRADLYSDFLKMILNSIVEDQKPLFLQKKKFLDATVTLVQEELLKNGGKLQNQQDRDDKNMRLKSENDLGGLGDKLIAAFNLNDGYLGIKLEPTNVDLKTRIKFAMLAVDSMVSSHFISKFEPSNYPVGLSTRTVVILLILLALVLGFISVIVAESMTNFGKQN